MTDDVAPRIAKLARWTSSSVKCIDVFADNATESYARFYRLAEEAYERLTSAAQKDEDVQAALIVPLGLRLVVACACELELLLPWKDLSEQSKKLLHSRAAQCLQECEITKKTLLDDLRS